MNDSYKVYASKAYVDEKVGDIAGLPEGAIPHQQLVTDANGNVTWENRTHYLKEQEIIIVEETTVSGPYGQFGYYYSIKPEHEYTVLYNGTEYKCISKTDFSGLLALGNLSIANPAGEDTGEPFILTGMSYNNEAFIPGGIMTFALFANKTGTHTFSVTGPVDVPISLPDAYIPSTVPVVRFATVGQTIAVKTVDENGKPTEWEASNLPEGFSGNYNDLTNKPTSLPNPKNLIINVNEENYLYRGDNLVSITFPKILSENDVSNIARPLITWDNLQNKPFGEMSELLNITLTLEEDSFEAPLANTINLEEGKSYTVTWNGVEYECVAMSAELENIPATWIGNLSFVGGPETEIPFLIGALPSEVIEIVGFGGVLLGLDGSTEVTVKIEDKTAPIKTIDPKYIPELEVPTVEVPVDSVNGKIGEIVLTAEDVGALPNTTVIPNALSDLTEDSTHRTVSDTEKATWNAKSNFSGNYNDLADKPSIPSIEGLATKVYVDNKVAAMVDSAPETLDTLKELSTALGEDPNFATTMATELGKKADASIVPTNLINGTGDGSLRMIGTAEARTGSNAFAEGQSTIAIGNASHVEGSIHYDQITISGSKDSNIYTVTDGLSEFSIKSGISILLANAGTGAYIIVDKDVQNSTITLDRPIATNQDIVNETYRVYIGGIAYGNSAHAENSSIAIGNYSHSEGCMTGATEESSHAEGQYSQATGTSSHAEGYSAKASGKGSHAEGYSTKASGYASHAEGHSTQATKDASHAEGHFASASGYASHAEGQSTYAKGYASHAEGYRTKASSEYQHAQGFNNIEDTENKYLHIVGNASFTIDEEGKINTIGTPSNAHTLDWNGLGWFAGGLKVGGTGQDDANAVEVALKTDIPTDDYINSLIDAKIASIPSGEEASF